MAKRRWMVGITIVVFQMDRRWRPRGQAVMRPFMVVARAVAFEARVKRRDARIVVAVKVRILDRPPEPFDQAIGQGAAPAIHTKRHPRPREAAGTGEAGTLDAWVGIDHCGTSLHPCALQRRQAAWGIPRMGQLPGQPIATPPVDARHERQNALGHAPIGDLRPPDLMGAAHQHRTEQRRGKFVVFGGRTGPWRGRHRLQPHGPHQPRPPLVVNRQAQPSHMGRHPRPPVKGRPGVRLVNAPPQLEVARGCRRWGVIAWRAVQPDPRPVPAEAAGPRVFSATPGPS